MTFFRVKLLCFSFITKSCEWWIILLFIVSFEVKIMQSKSIIVDKMNDETELSCACSIRWADFFVFTLVALSFFLLFIYLTHFIKHASFHVTWWFSIKECKSSSSMMIAIFLTVFFLILLSSDVLSNFVFFSICLMCIFNASYLSSSMTRSWVIIILIQFNEISS